MLFKIDDMLWYWRFQFFSLINSGQLFSEYLGPCQWSPCYTDFKKTTTLQPNRSETYLFKLKKGRGHVWKSRYKWQTLNWQNVFEEKKRKNNTSFWIIFLSIKNIEVENNDGLIKEKKMWSKVKWTVIFWKCWVINKGTSKHRKHFIFHWYQRQHDVVVRFLFITITTLKNQSFGQRFE